MINIYNGNNIKDLILWVEDVDNLILPEGLTLTGYNDFIDINIPFLPNRMIVNGTLNLSWSKMTKLPDDIVIDKLILTDDHNIDYFPNGVREVIIEASS